jgi:folate-binding protein YgfZ
MNMERPMPERTPLYDRAAQAGAVFQEISGWLVPGNYGTALGEYRLSCEHAGLFDQSHRGKIELTGPDAVSFLHNLCTNDIQGLPVGHGCEGFLTTAKAKVVAYARVFCLPGQENQKALWLDVDPGQSAAVVLHLNKYLISEQVEITDRTKDFGQLHLAGLEAKSVLTQLMGKELALEDLQILLDTAAGPSAWQIRRDDRLSVPGYDILSPAQGADRVWQALIDAGARPAGQEAFEILRLEAGTPVYGIDIDETVMAPEVGRTEQAISYTKGCYLGQETIVRTRDLGHVNRSLMGLKISGDRAVPGGSKLFREGKEVGRVTSSGVSPRLRVIALAYVQRGCQETGARLELQAAEGVRTAKVSSLPFLVSSGD